MTHVAWESRFTPARYGPPVDLNDGPWRTLIDPGQIAPADLAACEVLYYLRSDAVLRSVFSDRFDRVAWLSHGDRREFPRCQVYLSSMQASEQPTSVSVELTSVFVGTCWGLSTLEPVADGAATVATVLAQIKRVLRADKNRVLTVYRGSQQLQMANENVGFGPEAYGPLLDLEGRQHGVVHQIEAQYRLHINRNTGQIINLEQ